MNNKILIVDFNGTSPTYTHYYALEFKKAEYNIKILGVEKEGDLKIHEDKLSYIGVNFRSKLINYVLNWLYLLFISKSYGVIHIQWLQMMKFSSVELLFLKLLKIRNKNIFYTVHNIYPHNETNKLVLNRYNKVYNILDNLVVHSHKTQEKLEKITKEKNIIKIHHGLFYSEKNVKIKKHSNKMAMLGRISPYKGFEDAFSLVKEMKNNGLNYELHIEGDGAKDYILALKNKVIELGLENEISIIPEYMNTDRLIKLYNSAFVTLVPYKRIEQSGVVCTSLGLNTPVIAYDVGGLKDFIKTRINGALVKKGNISGFIAEINWAYENQRSLQKVLKNLNNNNNLWFKSFKIMKNEYFKS